MIDLTANDIHAWAISFIVGALLGVFYFFALWPTTRHLATGRHAKTWLFFGLAVRISVLMLGFVFILDVRHWEGLIIALLGFVLVRTVAIRLARPQVTESSDASPPDQDSTSS